MSSFLGAMHLLTEEIKWHGYVGYGSATLNFIAAAILVVALFPPFLDTRRSKKTYGVSESFFMYYVFGGVCMWLNAFLNILILFHEGLKKENAHLLIMFIVFICVNSLSLYLNSYILRVKRKNMRDAEAKGMSEQDYWEKYLNTEGAAKIDTAA